MLTSHDYKFLKELSYTNNDIYFLFLRTPDKPPNNFFLPSILKEIKSPSYSNDNELIQFLRETVERVKPDVIQAGPIHTVAWYVAQINFAPLITISWGYDLLLDTDKDKNSFLATEQVLSASKLLICDCETSKQKAIQLGFEEERIVTFPWGVDLTYFKPIKNIQLRQQLGWNNNFILLSTRRFESIYHVDLLVQAFIKIASNYPDVRLILIGNGSQKNKIVNILQSNNLMDKVYLLGEINNDEMVNYYNIADLYVSAAEVDGSSVSLMEALACGLPALLSDIPSNREWINANQHGWFFNCLDLNDLVKQIEYAVNARKQLPLMSRQVRKLAVCRADWNKNFLSLLTAYRLAIT